MKSIYTARRGYQSFGGQSSRAPRSEQGNRESSHPLARRQALNNGPATP